ncbi:MAG: Rieske 2Fe-2S domain-containing protein [Verrucomicrobiales bacterium]|nr:Rieske 2Fe-2S domain-containing protein [Verrucomicrobiales bacterium]
MSEPRFHAVADLDSLPLGQGRTVQVGNRRFALWNIEGQFYAIDDDCPHRGGPLGAGILQDGRIHCPLHGWAFDPKTGAGFSNPAKPVNCYPTKVEQGQVWIAF